MYEIPMNTSGVKNAMIVKTDLKLAFPDGLYGSTLNQYSEIALFSSASGQ